MTSYTQHPLAFLENVAALLLEQLTPEAQRARPVVRLADPDELHARFAALGVPLSLAQGQEPAHGQDAMLRAIEAILAQSVRTDHPMFFNQNFAGADPIAIVGDWLGALLNTTNATYEAAPVFTLMEQAVLQKLMRLAGWSSQAEGLFCAGGSMANLFALHLARHRVFPEAKRTGLPSGTRLVAFTSAHAHYSMDKAAALMGIGSDAMRIIPCDRQGRMRPDALDAAILSAKAQGETPFFVNATAGTTVVSAFDPLPAIAAITQQHGLWLHVDGCYGASALFSPHTRHWLEGVEQADSLAWNLHKMMGITQQCSTLLVRHRGLLASCFATRAAYLFQPDKAHAELDSGDKHFQCARRVDVLKLWLTWKLRGDEAFAARVEQAVARATFFEESIRSQDDFALAYPRSFTNVCFWWLPPSLRGKDPRTLPPKAFAALHQLAPALKAQMQHEGSMMLGFQAIDDLPNFWRMLLINPAVEDDDLLAVIALLRRYGEAHTS